MSRPIGSCIRLLKGCGDCLIMGNPYFNPFGFEGRAGKAADTLSGDGKPLAQDLRAVIELLGQLPLALETTPQALLATHRNAGPRLRYVPGYGTSHDLPYPGSRTLEVAPVATPADPDDAVWMEMEVYQCAWDLGLDPRQVSFDDWQDILRASAIDTRESGWPEIVGIFDLDKVRRELRLRYGGGMLMEEPTTWRSTEAVGIGNEGGGCEEPAIAA